MAMTRRQREIYDYICKFVESKGYSPSLEEIAKFVNPFVRGWVNYYGRYYPSALTPVLRSLERSLVYWVRRKFKRFRYHQRQAVHWLGRVAQREPRLFALWSHGIRPAAGQ